jgi:putative SOS response-associated peptidase YedK
MRPAPAGTLQHYGVDPAVGSVRNDGPELIEPAEPQALF